MILLFCNNSNIFYILRVEANYLFYYNFKMLIYFKTQENKVESIIKICVTYKKHFHLTNKIVFEMILPL